MPLQGEEQSLAGEMMLVFAIILREGDRLAELDPLCVRLCDKLALERQERELVIRNVAEVQAAAGASTVPTVLALRGLRLQERQSLLQQVMQFAASDGLLAPHQRRLAARVADILQIDQPPMMRA